MKVSTDGGGRWCVESAGINAYDDCYGIIPTSDLFNNPIYNMSLNTKNSVLYHSEFLSTVDGRETVKSGYKGYDYSEDESNDGDRCPSVDLPLFKGFTAANIQDFNKKLIETMKNVYAYNPDYNSLSVNVGTVTLQNYNPSFNSNILSINSEFIWDKGKTLNNYIFFGMANYAQYLSDLSTYSKSAHENVIKVVDADNKPLPQL